jgi:hypothetical protein
VSNANSILGVNATYGARWLLPRGRHPWDGRDSAGPTDTNGRRVAIVSLGQLHRWVTSVEELRRTMRPPVQELAHG